MFIKFHIYEDGYTSHYGYIKDNGTKIKVGQEVGGILLVKLVFSFLWIGLGTYPIICLS